MRDKLESLMLDYEQEHNSFVFDRGRLADYLIANGVTFASDIIVGRKWIPVSERLPKPHEDVLVYDSTAEEVTCGCLSLLGEWFGVVMKNEVTHWMPLPEPPKEE